MHVDGVLHRLEQQHVDAALDQPFGLLLIGIGQLIESDAAGDGNGLGRRPHRAGDEARLIRSAERVGFCDARVAPRRD